MFVCEYLAYSFLLSSRGCLRAYANIWRTQPFLDVSVVTERVVEVVKSFEKVSHSLTRSLVK